MVNKRSPQDLRRRAEEQLEQDPAMGALQDKADALALVHELQVHQIELQLQNRELRDANVRIEDLLAKYSDLYNFAPVGYFRLSTDGIIIELNLTGADLLGLNRAELAGRPIWSRVAGESHAKLRAFLQSLVGETVRQTTEVILLGKHRQSFYALIDGIGFKDEASGDASCRIAITDITSLKKSEKVLKEAYDQEEAHVRERTHELSNANLALAEARRDADLRAEHDRHIAVTLQRALVPPQREYQIHDFEVAVRYEAGSSEAEIGGDFFDVFEMGGGIVGILIGDVVGKGLAAAARAVAARHIIRSYAYLDASPAVVMTLANRAISTKEFMEEGMLTIAFVQVDAKSHTMTYTNAGHEPLLLRNRDGKVEELTGEGAAIGIDALYIYTEQHCVMEAGDLIVGLTDGITEARRRGELFGQEGAMQFLSTNLTLSLAQLVDGMLEAATSFANGALQDDAVVLAFSFH